MTNLLDRLFRRTAPMSKKRDPLPADLQAEIRGAELVLLNYDGGTASGITVLLDGEPWDCGIDTLGGGLQTSLPMDRKAASVAVRWVDEDGTGREWGTPSTTHAADTSVQQSNSL